MDYKTVLDACLKAYSTKDKINLRHARPARRLEQYEMFREWLTEHNYQQEATIERLTKEIDIAYSHGIHYGRYLKSREEDLKPREEAP